jgi:hypothetical protein
MPTRRRWIATLAQLAVIPIVGSAAQDQHGPAQPTTVTFIIEGMT